MEQLLESIAIGDIEMVTEGVFESKVSTEDYAQFKTMCNNILKKITDPKDEKLQKKNSESVNKALSKKLPKISISARKAKGLGHATFNIPSANMLLSFLRQTCKLRVDDHWIVTTTYGQETDREIKIYGPVGESAWVVGKLTVSFYKSESERYWLTLKVRPIRERDKKKLK